MIFKVKEIVVYSPPKIAEIMNNFFVNKIEKIIENIPKSNIDPLSGLKRLLQGKHLKNKFNLKPMKMKIFYILIICT